MTNPKLPVAYHKLLLYYINMDKTLSQYTVVSKKFNHRKLAAAIVESGMSQKKVADIMDVHHNTINNWCRGRTTPTFAEFFQLLDILGWDRDRLQRERMIDWVEITKNYISDV